MNTDTSIRMLTFNPKQDLPLVTEWTKTLFEYCNFQFINDVGYLGSIIQVSKILSVYHSQQIQTGNRDKSHLFNIMSTGKKLSLQQILNIVETLESNHEYVRDRVMVLANNQPIDSLTDPKSLILEITSHFGLSTTIKTKTNELYKIHSPKLDQAFEIDDSIDKSDKQHLLIAICFLEAIRVVYSYTSHQKRSIGLVEVIQAFRDLKVNITKARLLKLSRKLGIQLHVKQRKPVDYLNQIIRQIVHNKDVKNRLHRVSMTVNNYENALFFSASLIIDRLKNDEQSIYSKLQPYPLAVSIVYLANRLFCKAMGKRGLLTQKLIADITNLSVNTIASHMSRYLIKLFEKNESFLTDGVYRILLSKSIISLDQSMIEYNFTVTSTSDLNKLVDMLVDAYYTGFDKDLLENLFDLYVNKYVEFKNESSLLYFCQQITWIIVDKFFAYQNRAQLSHLEKLDPVQYELKRTREMTFSKFIQKMPLDQKKILLDNHKNHQLHYFFLEKILKNFPQTLSFEYYTRNMNFASRLIDKVSRSHFQDIIEFALEDIDTRIGYLNILEANLSETGGWQLRGVFWTVPPNDPNFKLPEEFALLHFDFFYANGKFPSIVSVFIICLWDNPFIKTMVTDYDLPTTNMRYYCSVITDIDNFMNGVRSLSKEKQDLWFWHIEQGYHIIRRTTNREVIEHWSEIYKEQPDVVGWLRFKCKDSQFHYDLYMTNQFIEGFHKSEMINSIRDEELLKKLLEYEGEGHMAEEIRRNLDSLDKSWMG